MRPSVLNAKYHQREAEIVAGAGQPGAVTIATNMAGRGTDIKLGPNITESKPSVVKDADGNDVDVMEMGGLHIVGSERHESRRIDRQLRGRAGRQGDPGASQFFLSLEDDLMRLFGSERIAALMDRMGAQEGEVLTHALITRSIESAQKRVELQNFQSRKRLLEYDDVMNQQREVIYSLRSFALEGGEELKSEALKMIEKAVARRVETVLAANGAAGASADEPLDFGVLQQELLMHYLLPVPALTAEGALPASPAAASDAVSDAAREAFAEKLQSFEPYGPGLGDHLLAQVMLHVLDEKWKDHLYDLDQLRGAIHYRSWGQKDPLIEYKQEAYTMFVDLMNDIYHTFSERFFHVQLVFEPPPGAGGPSSGEEDGPYRADRATNGDGRGMIEVVPETPRQRPTKRYNALGILEEIPSGEFALSTPPDAAEGMLEIGPDEAPNDGELLARPAELVTAGEPRMRASGTVADRQGASGDWSAARRNDPCPCGSGKKFKKCHGATI